MKRELLPCPFCGQQPEWGLHASADHGACYLRCSLCSVVKPTRWNKEDAINDWNTRAPDARVQLLAKALRIARDDIEAWREFCRDMGEGVGFGQSDFALETIDAALKEAGIIQEKAG